MPYATRELLEYYVAAGVDCALEDEPQDRFAESAAALAQSLHKKGLPTKQINQPARQPSSIDNIAHSAKTTAPQGFNDEAARTVRPKARIPIEEAVALARSLAAEANSLDELLKSINSFESCNLKKIAKKTVFFDGNPAAKIMFVGEAPSRDDEYFGKPFAGPAGQFMDNMIGSIGLDRSTTCFAHIVPWRPPGVTRPGANAVNMCRPFIERQIELIDPDILVLVGEATTKILTGKSESIVRLRGRWTTYQCNDRDMLAMPIFHPEYLLKQPAQKRLAWQDLLTIKRKLEESSSTS